MKTRKKTEIVDSTIKTQSVDNILEMKNITKTFLGGKIIANDNVSLSFIRNEIHALVGENGSGKSTLMNILFGLYEQDKGNIFINGSKVNMYSSGAAKHYKIGMVHQHFHLVENFSVIQNIILGQEQISSSKEKKLENITKLKEIEMSLSSFDKKEVEEIKEKFSKYFSEKILLHEYEYKLRKIRNEIKKLKNMKQLNSKLSNFSISKKMIIEDGLKINISYVLIFINSFEKNKTNNDSHNEINSLIRKSFLIKQKESQYNLSGCLGSIKFKSVLNRFSDICKKYNIDLDADDKVETLPVGKRQMVEILKVLWDSKDILVFDEPTATLSLNEINDLLITINLLKSEGKTIIFISHKLKEVKEISDRISILKKGVLINTYINNSDLKIRNISQEMVGKVIDLKYPKRDIVGTEIFSIKNISYVTSRGFKAVDNVSFGVKEGEIFGLAGIEGNGQEEVLKMISGLVNPSEGEIFFRKKLIAHGGIYKMNNILRRKFISHIPIDRHKHAMVPDKNLIFNSSISDYDTNLLSIKSKYIILDKIYELLKNDKYVSHDLEKLCKTLKISSDIIEEQILKKITMDSTVEQIDSVIKIINKSIESLYLDLRNEVDSPLVKNNNIKKIERKIENLYKTRGFDKIKADEFTTHIIDEFNVDGAYSNNSLIKNLSGGNQQKFVVGRELIRDHSLLLAGHPTRGLDIAAIDSIYKKIIINAKKKATILYSLEISELVAVCDRIAVMYKGKIVDIVNPQEISFDKISRMMVGDK